MHIGLCSPSWPPGGAANGIVSYVASLRDYLLSEGHEVSVIAGGHMHRSTGEIVSLATPTTYSSMDALRARVRRKLDHWHGSLPGVARTIAAQVRRAQAIAPMDVLEMEESFGWSGHVARENRLAIVTRLHGPQFLKPERIRTPREMRCDRQRGAAEGRAIRQATSLTAPTKAIMEVTCSQYGRAPSALSSVIPNPIALPAEDMLWRLDRCDRNHILMVGRFDYWKGADVMLSAFDRLLERRPSARLTLVGPDMGIEVAGAGTLGFKDYAQRFVSPEARARIDFRGTLSAREISDLRTDAYVAVIASRCENFPYVLLEALAAGSPVITSDWPGSDEIIVHGETGLLTPTGDAESLAERLHEIMSAPEAACRMAEAGRRRCTQNFSARAVGTRLLGHYRLTLERAFR